MSVLEQYQAASWRGVPFLVPSESEDGGIKNADHEYPDSDDRFNEQFGRMPARFKVEGIVHGDDAIQQRIRLIEALNTPGLGDLVHPIYGTVRVKAKPWSVKSSQKRMGEFIFTLEFAKSRESISPIPQTATPQLVTNIALEVNLAIGDALEETLVTPDKPALLDVTADKLTEISSSVSAKINAATNLQSDTLATFNRVSNTITDIAFKIAQSPADLVDSLSRLYNTALEVASTPAQLTESWKLLLDNVGAISDFTDTVLRKEKATNSNLLDEHTRLTVLANFFEAESYKDFSTSIELAESINFLNTKYKQYLDDQIKYASDAGLPSISSNPDVRRLFANLRNAALDAFNVKSQNLWRVVDINAGRSSMSLTAYRYYGNLDNMDLIAALNTSVNVRSFNESSLSAVSK